MKLFWTVAGLASLILGIIGVAVPLLPTVPFILLAAFCFARSSERLHDWLINHRQFGPMIADWQRNGAIHRRAKVAATVSIAAVFAISLAFRLSLTLLAMQAAVLCGVLVLIWSRPER